MSKSMIVAVAALLGLVAGDAVAQEQSTLQKILESGTLRVGTTGDFNPMSFKDTATGDYVGYDIDAVRKLAADMEVEIEFVATDWKTLVAGVIADKYDMTTSASLSTARAKVAGYSNPFIEFATIPVASKETADAVQGWEALDKAEHKIAVTLGTVFEQQARDIFQNAEIVAVEAPIRGYQEVLAGRADATITSNVDAAQLTTTHPELAVVSVDQPRNRRPGAFLLPQGDQVWINFVNHWVDLNHSNGYFEQLQDTWNITQ